MGKAALMLLVMLALSATAISGQGQTDQSIASATTTVPDYNITVNSDQNGNYVIGLRAEKEDCYVYFDNIKNANILIGTAQKTSPPASTAPTADYVTHEAGPEWGNYTVSKLPSKVSITSIEGGFERSKDLSKYIPEAFNNNYYVKDSIIKDDRDNEIGLKIKMQYPKKLKAHEKGVLEIEVITKDFGNAAQPDWQNNILSFCILKILSDENLSEEDEYVAGYADKGMSVTPVTIGIVAKPLQPINYWIRYDDSLYQTIKRDHPEFVVTDEVIDATTALIGEVPIMSTTKPGEKTGGGILFTFIDLLFTPVTGLDFDELLMAFAKWQVVYTVGNAPSEEFSNENHFDCWTYIFGFNVNENLCTGANGVRLNFPFSFDNEGEHEIKIHLDTMFEGDIPSLGVKGGRIGKEYSLSLPAEQSLPEETKEEEVVSQKSMDTFSWFNKGFFLFLFSTGKKDETIQAFDKAIEIEPRFAMASYFKGEALRNNALYLEGEGKILDAQSEYNEAIRAFDEVTERGSQYAAILALFDKQQALRMAGRDAEADAVGVEAESLAKRLGFTDPNNLDAMKTDLEPFKDDESMDAFFWFEKALLLMQRKDLWDEAIKAFDKTIEIEPKITLARVLKGGLLANQGKYEDAFTTFDEAAEIDPLYGSLIPLIMKYSVARNQGRDVEADATEVKLKAIAKKLGLFDEAELEEFFLDPQMGVFLDENYI